MKTIDITQLQQELQSATGEPYAVEDNGELVGYFYPAKRKRNKELDADWERLEKAIERVMKETGLDEEGLVRELAPTKLSKMASSRELAQFWDPHNLTDFEDELETVNEPAFVQKTEKRDIASKTIQIEATVTANGQLVAEVPPEVTPGKHQIIISI
jgi:hypothetical protein